MLTIKNSLLVSAVVFSLVACHSTNKEENTEAVTTSDSTQQETTEEDAPMYALPSPLQIASIFKRSGLNYHEGITNPISNSKKYTSNMSQSINLGVYSADLSYCALNKQPQLSINYLKASKQLADQLGLSGTIETTNLAKRFEKNIGNEDSLIYIIADIQMETDSYLEENHKEYVSSIVFAGAWIESMYIGSNIYKKSNEKKLLDKVVEQMTILGNIIKVLESHQNKITEITGVITELKRIETIYTNFESIKNSKSKAIDEESTVTLTEKEADELAKKIEEIRTKFING